MSREAKPVDVDHAALVEQARGGDLDALERVVRLYQDTAISYAFSLLGDYHAAEDAVQEAFVSAWMNFESLRDPRAFPGWLRRLVFTQCNRVKRRRRVPTVTLATDGLAPDPQPSVAADLETREFSDELQRAISSLPQIHREAVTLFYFGNRSQREIAAFLKVPVSTVNKRLHDARRHLKLRIERMVTYRDHERLERRVIDKVMSIHSESSVMSTLHPALRAASSNCSWARMMGILGHAFTFSMQRGGGECYWEGNLDWWLFFDRLPSLGYRFDHFQATQNSKSIRPHSAEALRKLKSETWDCVCASIDRGVPAMAWAPMTLEQRDDGHHAWDWNLLVGYDPSHKTYTVRCTYRDNKDQEVPFDGFGYCDPVQWYYVLVPREPVETDAVAVAVDSLEKAVQFARGTRFEESDACYHTDAEGLAAYGLWLEDLAAGTANLRYAPHFASLLSDLRRNAADFMVELRFDLPRSSGLLQRAEASYRQEVETLEELAMVCRAAREADDWGSGSNTEAAELLRKALEQDQAAIAAIEEVLTAI